ncbi:pimeloyl-ACP methyl ester carboxylesterase [Bacilli bacterium PM5-3]|nr:pimeloyl-ACP methyl ester carboxylesterase [Bacilli bacterium PM5-3]MDH6604300.1 pimeloyl-ACP methyl ester carboxylesterase [Bacilli bacterium PM5-9]
MEIVIDNMVINYEKVGHGQPVIVMHGWQQNLEMMYSIVGALSDQYEVYNIDLPGHGQSDEPLTPYTIDDYTTFLEKFIVENNIVNPIIIGHSFGCRIAIRYASRNENLDKMILTGAAGIMPKRTILYYFKIYTYKFFKLFKDVPFIKHYIQEMIDNGGSEDYKNSSPIMKEVLKNTVNFDLTPYLTEVNVPTLLIFGSNDDATPVWMGKIMNARISDSKLIIYEGCSHYAYLERIEDFNRDMLNFLKDGEQ